MNTGNHDAPLFPREWGWEKYEPAVREHAAQWARLQMGREFGVLTLNEQSHIAQLISNWDAHQVKAGLLPPPEEREAKGKAYGDIFKGLEKKAREALRDRDLGKAGTAHWQLEKEQAARQGRRAPPSRPVENSRAQKTPAREPGRTANTGQDQTPPQRRRARSRDAGRER